MNQHKIFLVEDNSDHALLIQRGLKESNCEVTHFSDGQSLLNFFKSAAGSSDFPAFILLDLKLPGLDGFEILSAIRSGAKTKRIPVVMFTTSQYQKEINRAYELGASGFVSKSENFEELIAKLARLKDYWLRTVELPSFEDAKR